MPASVSRRGSLFAIGGREARTGDLTVLEAFVKGCGGSGTRLVVLSTASSKPEQRVPEYEAAFRSLGVTDLAFFHQESREDAEDRTLLAAVDRADAVFFTGGNQLKLVSTLAGTSLESRLHERHRGGLHLGGTSAGASAMSAVMIARGKARSAARLAALRMSPGFGILPGVIIDQHFRERDRFGRLLTAVLCNPSMLGLGLDEDTAFALDADDLATVFGRGTLTIVDGSELEVTNVDTIAEEEPAAFAGIRMSALTQGWAYQLAQHRVVPPTIETGSREPVLKAIGSQTQSGDQR